MSITRRSWACVLVLSVAACDPFSPPSNPPFVAAGAITEAEVDPPPSQPVRIPVQGDLYADTDPSALFDFNAALDPYGTWTDDRDYGSVWVPNTAEVGVGFTPYVTAGHWVYDNDYVWVSDYRWGWAPFHYGRWVWIPARGWAWIPGRAYAGAWVDWRVADDWSYVGWAPMPPAWIWRGGVAVGIGFAPYAPYAFYRRTDLFAPEIASRRIVGTRAMEVARHMRPYVHPGPAFVGHPLARPYMHGPPPARLQLPPSRVVRPAPTDRGLTRAQMFARPSTARAYGARPAAPHVVRPAPIRQPPRQPPRAAPPRRR